MKTLETHTKIVLKFSNDPDGKEKAFVDINSSSGGYPYGAESILKAYGFPTIDNAKKYAGHFQTSPLKIEQTPIVVTIEVKVTE